MTPRQIIRYVQDPERDLSERAFLLMSTLSYLVLTVIFFWDVWIGESFAKLTFLGMGLLFFIVVVNLSVRLGQPRIGAVIASIGMVFFLLPLEFFTGGGIYGCTPLWYAYACMYIAVCLRGKIRTVMVFLNLLSAAVCYVLTWLVPRLLTVHTMKTAYLDSIASLIGVGTLLAVVSVYVLRLYWMQNEQTEKQKEEIRELSLAQNRFFSSMSHEIRTPINTIIGLNEMTLRENVSQEVAENALSIQAASKMLLATINDILDMSKIESGKMDVIPVSYDVGELLSELVNMVWSRAREKGLEFHLDVDSAMPRRLVGDEVRIKQVVVNILNNAVKYTEKGSVTLRVRCKDAGEGAVTATFAVEDTGMGIKKENLPYLFDAFRRVDEEKNRYVEGTGLGLSIVKQLVDLMGGSVSVDSIYTQGSTFTVSLPQKVEDAAALGELGLEERHHIRSRERYQQSFEAPEAQVLIVDDNDDNLMVESKLLRDTRVQVTTAESASRCLELTQSRTFHCILMDHLMPGMDGVECLQRIRTQVGGMNRETPVVVLTANAGSENQDLYRRAGFDGYLLKPVTGAVLEAMLLKHLPKEVVTISEQENEQDIGGLVREHMERLPILITTESVCDLPRNLTERLQIPVLPYRIFTDEGDFLEGVEAESDGVLDYMARTGKPASSHAPSVQEYEEFFAAQLSRATRICHLTVGSSVSRGYANAVEAAKAFNNVQILDSGQISAGLGLTALLLHKEARAETGAEELEKYLKKEQGRIRTSFLMDTPDFLVRSGRIGGWVGALCHTFMLRPVIQMRRGKLTLKGFVGGRKKRGWERYIKMALKVPGEIDRTTLLVPYVGLTNEDQTVILRQIQKELRFDRVLFQKASPAISTNSGPGTFGLMYLMKETKTGAI